MQLGTCENTSDIRTSAQMATATDKKAIRFDKCIGCTDFGSTCSGPNLSVLTIPELRLWVNRWREHYKLSISKCAAAWDMPEGTVARFLSSSDPDFRFATVQGIIQGILRYGQPADQQRVYISCPATSTEIQDQFSSYEKQLLEKTEENAELAARKLERANEYTERMAEQRENYEKHLANQEASVQFLRDLAAKRQRDLEKEEAQSANYLERIDQKNQQLYERDKEIKRLNNEILHMSSSHASEIKELVDRILRLTEEYSSEIKTLHKIMASEKST